MTRPPRHLSPAARRLYAEILETYALEAHHVALLVKALEAADRADQARDVIAASGILIKSRLGEVKPNPAIAIERDSRAAFLAGIKALGLDIEGPPPPSARKGR